jgi:hypothetical protein
VRVRVGSGGGGVATSDNRMVSTRREELANHRREHFLLIFQPGPTGSFSTHRAGCGEASNLFALDS